MSEEIILRQPSNEAFTFLDPQYRIDHLIVVLDSSKKVPEYDKLAKGEKDAAIFRAVDLDGERELMTFKDNHEGIVRDIGPEHNRLGVLIGRITKVVTNSGNDFYTLSSHTEEDGKRFHAWHADWVAGKPTGTGWKSPRPQTNGTTPTPSPAPVPVPAPTPAPTNGGTLDLSALDPATLALILAQAQAAK